RKYDGVGGIWWMRRSHRGLSASPVGSIGSCIAVVRSARSRKNSCDIYRSTGILRGAMIATLPVEPPHLVAAQATAPPSIDGALDDAAWALAASTTSFTQKFPDEGAAPSDRTT